MKKEHKIECNSCKNANNGLCLLHATDPKATIFTNIEQEKKELSKCCGVEKDNGHYGKYSWCNDCIEQSFHWHCSQCGNPFELAKEQDWERDFFEIWSDTMETFLQIAEGKKDIETWNTEMVNAWNKIKPHISSLIQKNENSN